MRINVGESRLCTACGSCEQICPRNCVRLQENEEGFYVPVIDEKACVRCGLCVSHCHLLQKKILPLHFPLKVVAVKHKNRETLINSSSGGVFSAVAHAVLAAGGVVVGCKMDSSLNVYHDIARSTEELAGLRGSKYVASDTRGVYRKIRRLLDDQMIVCFTGCPCQVAGLKAFLGKDYTNLLTMDLICHGAPSRKLFMHYLSWLEEKNHQAVKSYRFRSKEKYGWSLTSQIEYEHMTKTIKASQDPYYSIFLNGSAYAESCYECRYACDNRIGDITIGDFWGVDTLYPEFYDPMGVSLVTLNTPKGEEFFLKIENDVVTLPADYNQAKRYNPNLMHPTQRPSCRDFIYHDMVVMTGDAFFSHRSWSWNRIKKIIAAYMPPKMKRMLKRYLIQ